MIVRLFLLIVKDDFLLIYRAKTLERNRNNLEKILKKVSVEGIIPPPSPPLLTFFFFESMSSGEPAVVRKNDCLNAAKACNLNDTCKKYRSAYISPCTSRVSTAEVCNKRKCHKALRQFFDKARRLCWGEQAPSSRDLFTEAESPAQRLLQGEE